MKISRIVEFLERVKEADGDLEVQTIVGLQVKTIPATGERVVVCFVCDTQMLEEALRG